MGVSVTHRSKTVPRANDDERAEGKCILEPPDGDYWETNGSVKENSSPSKKYIT